jgi:hypothetical protein
MFLGKSFLHALAAVRLSGGVDGAFLEDILAEYKEAAHPENAFLNEFEESFKTWITSTLGDNERLVIFIDDLDRCLPEIALQVLEALKLYLNIPKLIFVVGVDKVVVEKLVVDHYRKLGLVRPKTQDESDEDQPLRETEENKARQYLCKMFQVEVELAPTQEQVRTFLDDQLEGVPYWKDSLSDEHRELFEDLVLKLAGRNPREVKRLLNSGLMAAAGTMMATVGEGEDPLRFARGLQQFFVRKILQTRSPSLAWMIDTDDGARFFTDWSRLVNEYQQMEKQPSSKPEVKTSEDDLLAED